MKKGVLGEPQRRQKGFKAMSNINRFAQTTTDIFCPGINYDPFAAPSEDPFENIADGLANKPWCYGSVQKSIRA